MKKPAIEGERRNFAEVLLRVPVVLYLLGLHEWNPRVPLLTGVTWRCQNERGGLSDELTARSYLFFPIFPSLSSRGRLFRLFGAWNQSSSPLKINRRRCSLKCVSEPAERAENCSVQSARDRGRRSSDWVSVRDRFSLFVRVVTGHFLGA